MTRKVLYVIASLRTGGAQSLLVYTLECLHRVNRYEFAVVTVLPGGMFVEGLENSGVPVYSLDVSVPWDIRAIPRLKKIIARVGPDVIHAHLFYADIYTVLANRGEHRLPQVYTEHSVSNARRSIPLFRPIDRWVMKQYDRVVAVGEGARDAVIEWAGVDPARTLVIPNGLNLDNFPSPADKREVRRSLGLSDDDFVMISVVRLAPEKGLDRLLAACSMLIERGRRFRLLVVGDGPLRSELEALREQLNLRPVVTFLGTRRDVPDLLIASDLFVLSSLWEGLPIALLEAMGSRVPAVATAVGAIPEVIRDGVDGHVVPPDQVPALAEAMGRVMSLSPAEREAMGRHARERVEEKYDIAVLSRRLLDLYDDLLAESHE